MTPAIRINTVVATALSALAAIAVSCSSPDDDPVEELSVIIPLDNVGSATGSQFISTNASGPWTASIDCGDALEWASLKDLSGTGACRNTLYWDSNPESGPRSLTVSVSCGGRVASATMKQEGSGTPGVLTPDPVRKWLELPATDVEGCFFFTHDMPSGSSRVRNYSFYLDPAARISRWVAYPLNKSLIGSGGRTNEWALDPKVPSQYQASIASGGLRGGYERGHQIPSADRLGAEANRATFYGTNITPQKAEFNEFIWATLEGMVRGWSYSFDTLYVVTGADIRGSSSFAYDNDGKQITVPTGYYKALLGYRKNASSAAFPGQVRGYLAIGFYFKHQAYSTVMPQSMTIDELEEMTGTDFFVNLSSVVTSEEASKIESVKSSWWK